MIENPKPGQGKEDEKTDSREVKIRGRIAEILKQKEYADVPPNMRKIAIDVARHALSIPRDEKLLEEIEKLDEIAARAERGSAAKYDRNTKKPLMIRRSVEENRIKPPGGVLDQVDQSTIITRFDRELIADRTSKVRLVHAKQFRGMKIPDIFKEASFIAAVKLCKEITYNCSRLLSKEERWDTAIPPQVKRVNHPIIIATPIGDEEH